MNIEKYNQKLLAIIGTLLLVGSGIFVISGIILFSTNFFSNRSVDNSNNSLPISSDSTNIQNSNNDQFNLSFSEPKLIDSTKALFVISCGQVKEFQSEELSDELVHYTRMSSKDGFYGYRGSYNNIILFERLKEKKTSIFNKKVSIAEFHIYNIKGKLFLFISASELDTNKDGMLNRNDLHSLYIYDIENDNLNMHKFPKAGVNNFSRLDYSDEFVVELVSDINNDGEIDQTKEPSYFKHINDKFELSDLVPSEMTQKLQKLIN